MSIVGERRCLFEITQQAIIKKRIGLTTLNEDAYTSISLDQLQTNLNV